MNLISWNVNGLRAVYKKGAWDEFLKLSPDIFMLQETKSEPSQLPDEVKAPPGYHSFFESSKTRKGYSGVALYTKVEPEEVKYVLGVEELDQEGRLITAFFKDFVLLNVYFPNGGGGPHRLEYKLNFYDAFLDYVDQLRQDGREVIFGGDINTAHEEIDLARPKENEEHTGFLPEERAWLDEVVRHGYIDTFRHFHPSRTGAYTYWDMKTAARERNVGWRIDYFFVSPGLLPRLKGARILSDMYGSDHCPIEIEIG